jgi:hypothetical protein
MLRRASIGFWLLGLALAAVPAHTAETVKKGAASGAFVVDPPTLVSLGFAWTIEGDDDRNARVESSYRITESGTAERPIVIKGAGDGEAVFDGEGCANLFNLMGGSHHFFEGITVRNANVAFLLGIKSIAGASGFTLKYSRIEDVGRGVQADWSGSKNFYIADNVLIGRHDPEKMMGWNGAPWAGLPGFPERLDSEYAVKVYGQGHVVAYNRIEHWHDGIDVATYGVPDGAPDAVSDLLQFGLQRLPSESRKGGVVPMEFAGRRSGGGLHGVSTGAALPDVRGIPRGGRAGPAQHSLGLRCFRAGRTAGRPRSATRL